MNASRLLFIAGILMAAASGLAQTAAPSPEATPAYSINLTDGRVIQAVGLRRDGANVIASQALPAAPGAAPVIGQVGYAVRGIKSIDFPEPPELDAAVKLLATGKSSDAATQIAPAVTFAESFADIPGNRWAQLAVVELKAFVQAQKETEAEALATRLTKSASNPEEVFSARLQIAGSWVRKGQYARALPVFDEVIQKGQSSDTLATAWLNKGHALMAANEPEAALLAYLKVNVLYPEQTLLLPAALMGSARAYTAMGDSVNASRAKQDLLNQYPNSPEAASLKADEAKR